MSSVALPFSLAAILAATFSPAFMSAAAATPEAAAQSEELQPIEIREWEVPFEASRPRDPFAVSSDEVWFVGQRAGYLARLNPETGEFFKKVLKEGSGPHNLIVASDGIVWYAGNRTSLIGRYDPVADEIEEIAMPNPDARDPHTLVFDGAEENIWFTVQGGNMVGRLHIENRKVELIHLEDEKVRPYGIKMGPDGDVWVALFGTNKLARVDAKSMRLKEIDLPREDARPRRIEVSADGMVWYVDYAFGMLGRYDPKKNKFAEWPLPQGEMSRPYGMAQDGKGRIYMVASGPNPNVFLGFDPKTERFFAAGEVPSGGGTVRHMHYHAPTDTIWFGTDTNYIGRARAPTADES